MGYLLGTPLSISALNINTYDTFKIVSPECVFKLITCNLLLQHSRPVQFKESHGVDAVAAVQSVVTQGAEGREAILVARSNQCAHLTIYGATALDSISLCTRVTKT